MISQMFMPLCNMQRVFFSYIRSCIWLCIHTIASILQIMGERNKGKVITWQMVMNLMATFVEGFNPTTSWLHDFSLCWKACFEKVVGICLLYTDKVTWNIYTTIRYLGRQKEHEKVEAYRYWCKCKMFDDIIIMSLTFYLSLQMLHQLGRH